MYSSSKVIELTNNSIVYNSIVYNFYILKKNDINIYFLYIFLLELFMHKSYLKKMKRNFQKNENFPGKYRKFDDDGSYTHFPGTTIVSFLSQKLFSDFRYWVVTTKPTFTKYYSMLDDESYHATIKNNTVGSTDLSRFDVVAMKNACKIPPCQYLVASTKKGLTFEEHLVSILILLEILRRSSKKLDLILLNLVHSQSRIFSSI